MFHEYKKSLNIFIWILVILVSMFGGVTIVSAESADTSVEIAITKDIYIDQSKSCMSPNGTMACLFFGGGPYKRVIDGVNAANPLDRLLIMQGSYSEQLTIDKAIELTAPNGNVTIGQ